jgi:uncharacterized small protein (DUF1192 family)
VEQFKKTWKSSGKRVAKPSPKKPVDEATKGEMKDLFRKLAKRYHPDLVEDPEEKRTRARTMAQVNEAYAAGDLGRLRALMERRESVAPEPSKTRTSILVELRKEVHRLDRVVASLQDELKRLTNSHTVQLMLEASIARGVGRDLLSDLASDLQAEIARLEVELATLGDI